MRATVTARRATSAPTKPATGAANRYDDVDTPAGAPIDDTIAMTTTTAIPSSVPLAMARTMRPNTRPASGPVVPEESLTRPG